MTNLLTPPPDTELSDSATRALKKLPQRSPGDLTRLTLLYTKVADTFSHGPSFFLPVPSSPYTTDPKTPTAMLQDTEALLAMTQALALLVLCRIEGRFHNMSREDASKKQ